MNALRKTIASAVLLGLLTGCASNRHLVFFTNTTIGVEVSSEPNASQPLKFVLGYKRAEGVLDPLAEDKGAAPDTGVSLLKPEGHSVMAKLNFGTGGGSTTAENAQWFATGEAARSLARSEMAPAALTGSVEIAKQTVSLSAFRNANERRVRIAAMGDVYSYLSKVKAKDPSAASSVEKLDSMNFAAIGREFTAYEESPLSVDAIKEQKIDALTAQSKFSEVSNYYANLSRSVAVLTNAVGPKGELKPKIERANSAIPTTPEEITALQSELRFQEQRLAFFDDKMADDPAVVQAAKYFVGNLFGG